MKTIKLYQHFFESKDCELTGKDITSADILKVLKGFAVDKSSGLDDWTVEFFRHFYDMMGDEINEAIDATRRQGVVPDCLNLTYITLIHKKDIPVTFNEYILISLCKFL